MRILALAGILGLLIVAPASAQTPPNPTAKVDDATEVNKELSNPISSIWALQIQENTYFIHPGIEDKSSRNSVNVQFQPVLPLALTDDWNLITRPVFQVVNSVPVPTPTGRVIFVHGRMLNLVGSIFWFLFILFVTLSELRSVLKQREVTGETICMAVSVYLLMGFTWTFLYGVMLVAGKGGERATFKAQGVGKILDGGGVSYRGAQYFYSDSPKFSGLNRIAVVFEYEADAEGNTKTKLFEWK